MTTTQVTTLISIKNNGKRPGACPGHLMKLYLTLPGQDFSSRPLTLPKRPCKRPVHLHWNQQQATSHLHSHPRKLKRRTCNDTVWQATLQVTSKTTRNSMTSDQPLAGLHALGRIYGTSIDMSQVTTAIYITE